MENVQGKPIVCRLTLEAFSRWCHESKNLQIRHSTIKYTNDTAIEKAAAAAEDTPIAPEETHMIEDGELKIRRPVAIHRSATTARRPSSSKALARSRPYVTRDGGRMDVAALRLRCDELAVVREIKREVVDTASLKMVDVQTLERQLAVVKDTRHEIEGIIVLRREDEHSMMRQIALQREDEQAMERKIALKRDDRQELERQLALERQLLEVRVELARVGQPPPPPPPAVTPRSAYADIPPYPGRARWPSHPAHKSIASWMHYRRKPYISGAKLVRLGTMAFETYRTIHGHSPVFIDGWPGYLVEDDEMLEWVFKRFEAEEGLRDVVDVESQ
jgi:hypothetical protein